MIRYSPVIVFVLLSGLALVGPGWLLALGAATAVVIVKFLEKERCWTQLHGSSRRCVRREGHRGNCWFPPY